MLRKKAPKAINIAKLIYTPLCLSFILYFSWINRELLYRISITAELGLLGGAAVFWSLMHISAPLFTNIILRGLNKEITYSHLLHIYISRLPARYLPGGVWHTVGRFCDYYNCGATKTQLTLLAGIETFLPGLITFSLGGGYIWLAGPSSKIASLAGIFAAGSITTLLFIPVITSYLKHVNLRRNWMYDYFVLIILAVIYWIFAATSFLFYYSAFTPEPINSNLMIYTAASYLFAWGIGYISIFAPQGVGIFEIIAGKLMVLPMGLGGAIVFIAGFRIVSLAADLSVCLMYFFTTRLLAKKLGASG